MKINNSKILVTGASGFIGANLLKYLSEKFDVELHAASRTPRTAWRLAEMRKKKNFYTHAMNIQNPYSITKTLDETMPEIVVNCATYGMYMGSEKDKARMMDVNIQGTVNLFTACHDHCVKKFIHTGSSSEYGIKNSPMREDMLLEPVNTYGACKAATTVLLMQLAQELRLPCVMLRLFSPYGSFEDKKRLIPSIILSCLDGKRPQLRSPGSVRDFIHVDDVVAAYQRAIELDAYPMAEVFNVGSGFQHSVCEVAKMISDIVGSHEEPEYSSSDSIQEEPPMWVSDRRMSIECLGWQPKLNTIEGLMKSVKWFRDNRSMYQ